MRVDNVAVTAGSDSARLQLTHGQQNSLPVVEVRYPNDHDRGGFWVGKLRGPHPDQGFGGCRHAVLAEDARYHCGQEGGSDVTTFPTTVAAAPHMLISEHFDTARSEF